MPISVSCSCEPLKGFSASSHMMKSIGFWKKLGSKFADLPLLLIQFLILSYRIVLAPTFGGACRFEPSCSLYAQECFQKLPFFLALKFSVRRLLKCRPGGDFGFDLVPSHPMKVRE